MSETASPSLGLFLWMIDMYIERDDFTAVSITVKDGLRSLPGKLSALVVHAAGRFVSNDNIHGKRWRKTNSGERKGGLAFTFY